MKKVTEREVRAMVEDAGFGVVAIRQNRHWRVRVRRPDGSEFNTSFPITPSDHRSLKNKRAQLKHQGEQ